MPALSSWSQAGLPCNLMLCVSCGGDKALASQYSRLVCDRCWTAFVRWQSNPRWGNRRRDDANAEIEFNRWLARQLSLAAKRIERFGVAGRCEAMVDNVQCGNMATRKRKGRRLCWSHHSKASEVILTDDPQADPYVAIATGIADLARQDAKFAVALSDALNNAKQADAA